MIYLLTLPFISISVFLYLNLTFFGNSFLSWTGAIISGIIFCIFSVRGDFKKNILELYHTFKPPLNILFILLIFGFVFLKAFVLSPFVLTKTVNNFEHIQITDVGDYYKHTFVVSSLAQDGIPPFHPYFPSTKFSYYYGYYLIPAAITKVFGTYPNITFYFYSLVTDLIGLLVIFLIISRLLKLFIHKILALLLLITASSIDVIPAVFINLPILNQIVSQEMIQGSTGLQLLNIYKSMLFVPQHFFVSCLTVSTIYLLLFEKSKNLIIISNIVFIILSSIFVSITLGFWLMLVFFIKKQERLYLIIVYITSFILLIPFFSYLSNRSNLLSIYQFQPYNFVNFGITPIDFVVDTLFTFLVKYGPLLSILPLALVTKKVALLKRNLIYILGISIPFILTWFIKSPLFNDFSLRTLLPVQLIIPVFLSKLVDNTGKNLRFLLIILYVTSIFMGGLGLYFEYIYHWRSRKILHPNDSELLLKIRTLPSDIRLSSIDRDRWVEFIPSLSFKKVLSPFLYESFVYFIDDKNQSHANYELLALNLFINPDTGKSIEDLINSKNSKFSKLQDFFSSYSFDKLILPNKLWVKKDKNPWLEIFREMGMKEERFTSHYSLLNYQSLIDKLSAHQLQITNVPTNKVIINRKFILNKGLWYIAFCSKNRFHAKFELEDYYLLFDQKLDGMETMCTGKIFYLESDEELLLTTGSTVDEVFVYPIKISKK